MAWQCKPCIDGMTVTDSQHPSICLKQVCPLSATLFGLFINGLHQYFQDAVPDAGVRVQHLKSHRLDIR